MSKKLAASIAFILVIAGAAVFASPYLTLQHIRNAADRHDAAAISAYVDYPSVRDSLKVSLRDAMRQKMGAQRDNPLASFALSIGGWVSDRMVDAFLTPDNIAALMRGEDWTPLVGQSAAPEPAQPPTENTPLPSSPGNAPAATAPVPPSPANSSANKGQQSAAPQGDDGKRAQIDAGYQDFNHFLVHVHRRNAPEKVVTFVLTRQGIVNWKLTAIQLPPM